MEWLCDPYWPGGYLNDLQPFYNSVINALHFDIILAAILPHKIRIFRMWKSELLSSAAAPISVAPTCVWEKFKCDHHLNCGFKFNSDESGCPGRIGGGGGGSGPGTGPPWSASTMSFLVVIYLGVVLRWVPEQIKWNCIKMIAGQTIKYFGRPDR